MSYEVRNKLLEKQRAAGYPGGTEDNKKQYTSVRERLLSKTTEENIRSARKKVSNWADKYNTVMKGVSDYQSKLKGGYTKDASGGYAKAIDELVRDYDGIKSYANRMGLPNAQRYLKQLQQMQRGIRETNAYMSQFLDEADYNHKASRDNRLAALKQYDVASNEATSKRLNDAIVEASGIREQLGIYQNDALTRLTQRNKVDALQKRLDDITKEFGSLDEMKARASVLQQDIGDAKRVQNGVRMAENAKADRDFDTLGNVNMANTDAKYRYINDENYRRQYDAMVQNNAMEGHKPVNNFSEAGLDLMNSEERQLYNYYWAKGGSEAAESYLDSIREELNSRKARTIYEDLSGDEWMDTAMKFAYAGEAGIDQWQSGAKGAMDMLSGKDSYVPATAKQMASSMAREDLKDVGPKMPDWMGGASLGQMGYDTISTTANMAPSILASTVANMIAPGSGQVVGNIMLGGSALGGAYQNAINRGYDKGRAGLYASMIGASEVGLNYMLGGISKLGGVVTNGAVEAMLSKVDNAILRTAGKIGGNMLSEGLEEGLQEIMTTWFSNIALGTSEKVSWDQVLYSGLMGSLTAGVFEGTDVVSSEVNVNTQGRALKARGVTGSQLAELGKTFDIGSKARELAERVNDSTDAYTMGRLFREVGAGLSDQSKADIAKSLMDKGMSQELAVKHAEIMEYIVEGGEVSNLQMKMIQKNDVLAETMREVIYNADSSVGKRNAAYTAMQQAEAVSDAPVTESTAVSEAEPEPEGNLLTEENEDYEALYGGREDGKTYLMSTGKAVEPGKVAAIKDGKVTIETKDGKRVDADDVEFGDQGYDLVFRSITSAENMTPEGANTILQIYKQTGAEMTASAYTEGAAQVYRQGYYGMKNTGAGLSSMQAEMIYSAGRRAAMEHTQSAQAAVAKNATAGTAGKVHFDGDTALLTERQRTSISALEKIADVMGVQFHIFESQTDGEGNRIGANGWYEPADNSIHIDLHAGANGEGTMLFTAAHELTHHIRQWSPEKFKTLSDFLMTEYGSQDVDVDALVAAQIEKAQNSGRELSYDAAFEEVVADSMETMLSDGKALEKLTKLKQQDRSLWQKVKDFISDLAAKIRSVYDGMTPDSAEGRLVAEMKDSVERLQDLFVEGLEGASANYQASLTPSEEGIVVDENGDSAETQVTQIDQDLEAEVKYSIREKFYIEFDAWDKKNTNVTFVTGTTSDALRSIGMKDQEIVLRSGTVLRKLKDHPEMTFDIFKKIPDLLEHPVIVQFSDAVDLKTKRPKYDSSITVLGELYADVKEGGKTVKKPVLVSLELLPTNQKKTAVLDFAVIKSAYSKNALQQYLHENSILYIDPNKKRTDSWLSLNRLQLPLGEKSYGPIRKIAYVDGKVKVQSPKNMSEIQKIMFEAGIIDEFGNKLLSDRDTDSISNRNLLVNALEGAAQTQEERQKLQDYRKKIETVEDAQRRLDILNRKIREATFAPGKRDTAKIEEMRKNAAGLAETINNIDKKLLSLEASAPLKAVLEREKKKAYQRADQRGKEALKAYREKAQAKQQQIAERYQESRAKGIESRKRTAMRHKVQGVVKELNQYLLKGNKEKHVPISLQKAVAEALNAVNMDTVGADERVALLNEKIAQVNDPDIREALIQSRDRIQSQGDRMADKLKALRDSYNEFIHSDDPLIANSHDDVIAAKLESVIETVGDTPLRDMTVGQLEDVYDMYKMVLTSVRNANKAFKAAKGESIAEMGYNVMSEVEQAGGKKQYGLGFMGGVKKFFWNNLKPVYAFEHIGSRTLAKVFENVRAGEDTWARDVVEAREFYLDKAKKYGYNDWDTNQWHTFESTSGMEFSLNLPQIMSLYAYSKREQAAEHLRKGGIVIDETTEVTMKTKLGIKVKFNPTEATAYNISDATLADIVSKLTPEQKAFVDEMQDYLSTTMGEKGNEVSLQMYGIKLFKEKNYFPLKSATQYMAKAKEQQKGEVKIKNSGFSKETVKKANNPVVLTPFMEVWAEHVNDMSMYHGFVLPLEDFYRVYNFKTATSDSEAVESVEMKIQNAYGKGATGYIDQLLKDLNGGARTDSTTGVITKGMNLFKKGAVFASASVVIQQPSAIARATALIDSKYFLGRSVDKQRHKELWAEIKKYAPVATIKEMGYFDTNMGKSTQDFLMGKEYESIAEKMQALFTDGDYRDEILSKAPALADELAWCAIWEACQRETIEKHPGMMRRDREGFKKLVGERFTEVIVKTQVYDSVLSRSANMRSKDTGMKMATAFMAEPTTSINMITDALLQGKRGNKRYARKAIGSVLAAQLLNSILVSFVYAARDKDEDETYWEKYAGSMAAELIDGVNPLTYIPFIKDIVSIVQGYEVERSDMAVISDLWNGWKKLGSETATTWDKVESFAGSVAQIFGLPVKNIMRDMRSIGQFFETVSSGEKNTWPGTGYALREAVFGKNVARQDKLYDALLGKDAAQLERVKKWYLDDANGDPDQMKKDMASAMRTAIKDRYVNEEIDAMTASKYLVLYGDQDVEEIQWTLDKWNYIKEHGSENGYDKYSSFYEAIDSGEDLENVVKSYKARGMDTGTLSGQITGHYQDEYLEMAGAEKQAMGKKLVAAWIALGYTKTEAEKSLAAWDFESESGFNYQSRKELYLDGEITAAQVKEAAMTYGGLSEAEADFYLAKLDFEKENGYAYDDIRKLYLDKELTADQVRNAVMTVGGKSQRQADEYLAELDFERENGYSYENRKDAYISGQITAEELRSAMVSFGGASEKEADAYVDACDWLLEHPGSGLSIRDVQSYTKEIKNYGRSIEDVGISPDLFVEIQAQVGKCEGTDSDGDGEADHNSIKNQKMAVIDSFDLTVEQKDALYFYNNWAKSKLRQAPWH